MGQTGRPTQKIDHFWQNGTALCTYRAKPYLTYRWRVIVGINFSTCKIMDYISKHTWCIWSIPRRFLSKVFIFLFIFFLMNYLKLLKKMVSLQVRQIGFQTHIFILFLQKWEAFKTKFSKKATKMDFFLN